MKLITPIILIVISLGTFFLYTEPVYRGKDIFNGKQSIKILKEEHLKYQEILKSTIEIEAKSKELEAKKNSFSNTDLEKLERVLPDHIDGIELIVDVNKIAKSHDLIIKDVELKNENNNLNNNKKYGTLSLSFSVKTSYPGFLLFLSDLEKSSRLFEIDGLIINGNDSEIYDFQINLKTFWLK